MDTNQALTLTQAAQAPNVQGALQQLLLSRIRTPEQQQQLEQRRAAGLQKYQQALQAEPYGSYTPTEHAAYTWIGNMGKMNDWAALTSGIAAGGSMLGDIQKQKMQNNVTAGKVGYEDAKDQEKIDTSEMAAIRGMTTGKLTVQGMEKIMPLYGRLFNSFSQQAKDIQFTDPEERRNWIKASTDAAVASAVEQFGGNVNQEVLARLHQTAVAESAGGGTSGGVKPGTESDKPKPVWPNTAPETDPTSIKFAGPNTIGPVSGSPEAKNGTVSIHDSLGAKLSVPDRAKAAKLIERINDPTSTSTSRQSDELELKRLILTYQTNDSATSAPGTKTATDSPMSPETRSKFNQQNTLPGNPPFVNKPNEAMMKEGAKTMGSEYGKDYADMREVAAAAKEQLDAYTSLEAIDPNTNAFANAQGYVGMALQGLGLNPNTPLIQDAIKNRQANVLIAQMSNAALRGEKGVQARSDEVRIKDELARTTDPKQAWKFLIQLGKERALRRMEMFEYAGSVAEKNNGVPIMARQKYINETANDPLTQRIGNKLVTRSQFIRDFLNANKGAQPTDAIGVWRQLEDEFIAGKRK